MNTLVSYNNYKFGRMHCTPDVYVQIRFLILPYISFTYLSENDYRQVNKSIRPVDTVLHVDSKQISIPIPILIQIQYQIQISDPDSGIVLMNKQ